MAVLRNGKLQAKDLQVPGEALVFGMFLKTFLGAIYVFYIFWTWIGYLNKHELRIFN
jgi:hypothetical protein